MKIMGCAAALLIGAGALAAAAEDSSATRPAGDAVIAPTPRLSTREAPLAGPRSGQVRPLRPGADRPRRPRLGPGPAADKPPEITPEQVDEFLAFTQKYFPRIHERLNWARRNDPAAFRMMMRRASGPLARMFEMSRRDPAAAEKMIEQQKIEMEILELRQAYRSASESAERERLRQQLQARFELKFDLRLERLKMEVEQLRRRLDEQTSRLSEQERRRDEVIRLELREFLAAPGERRGDS